MIAFKGVRAIFLLRNLVRRFETAAEKSAPGRVIMKRVAWAIFRHHRAQTTVVAIRRAEPSSFPTSADWWVVC